MSEYVRKTWVNGELITHDALNNIEQGIVEAMGKVTKSETALKKYVDEAIEAIDAEGDNASDVLPIEKGGTGAKTAETARTNLGAAAEKHEHSATDITSGTLSYQRGGTGVSATDAKGVRDGLGAAAKSQSAALTVAASAWTGDGPYTATVACTIATASNHLEVGVGGELTADQFAAIAAAMIVCTGQAEGNITLTAFGAMPEIDIPVNVLEVG